MPKVFLDTDVAFDIISKRDPHFDESVKMLEYMIEGHISLMISESSVANLIYLSFDIYKIKDAEIKLVDFMSACDIVAGGKQVIIRALQSRLKDKEDALQYCVALNHGVDYFVTRNIKDYKHANESVPVMRPSEFINLLN